MLDKELAAAVEKIGQRLLSSGRVEHILLFNAQPREGAPLGGQLVAKLCELLFLGQKADARLSPVIAGHDHVLHYSPPVLSADSLGKWTPMISVLSDYL